MNGGVTMENFRHCDFLVLMLLLHVPLAIFESTCLLTLCTSWKTFTRLMNFSLAPLEIKTIGLNIRVQNLFLTLKCFENNKEDQISVTYIMKRMN